MKIKKLFIGAFAAMLFSSTIYAQTSANDILIADIHDGAREVLFEYVKILNSPTLDEAAEKFVKIAGGNLVSPDGSSLRSGKKEYSLKKDYDNIKFYKQDPVVITRVNKTYSNGQGYGASAIKGYVYKVWIEKENSANGRPAPVSIMVPEDHATIKDPKVINIGSL